MIKVAGSKNNKSASRKSLPWFGGKNNQEEKSPVDNDDYFYFSDPKENIERVEKIVEEYEGYTAEVIKIMVSGRKKVNTWRLLTPGDKVDLRLIKGSIKVFAFGEFIAEPCLPEDSRIIKLLEDGLPFDAYLGGRDLAFANEENVDFCSIIIFYQLPGVAPTKVSIK